MVPSVPRWHAVGPLRISLRHSICLDRAHPGDPPRRSMTNVSRAHAGRPSCGFFNSLACEVPCMMSQSDPPIGVFSNTGLVQPRQVGRAPCHPHVLPRTCRGEATVFSLRRLCCFVSSLVYAAGQAPPTLGFLSLHSIHVGGKCNHEVDILRCNGR